LAAFDAASRGISTTLITFGAPRVGNAKFVERFVEFHKSGLIKGNMRFVHLGEILVFSHIGDPVPQLPPISLVSADTGYRDTDTAFTTSNDMYLKIPFLKVDDDNHEIGKYIGGVEALDSRLAGGNKLA
jgi:hypothetical protein